MAIRFCSCGYLCMSIEGNEQADEVAKAATLRPAHACLIPYRNLFFSIQSAMQATWQCGWEILVITNKMGEVMIIGVCLSCIPCVRVLP